MKITFVEGTYSGMNVTTIKDPFGFNLICGQYRHKCETLFYKQKEDEIIVVKQRSVWFTALIFIHEFLHYVNRKTFNKRKIDKWIDNNIKRKRDR